MSDKKIKIIYISGWGRSGSTILSTLLGQIDGFFSVGELRYVWERGFLENRLCGCSYPYSNCKFWQEVINTLNIKSNRVDPVEMYRLTEKYSRTFNTYHFLNPLSKKFKSKEFHVYLSVLENLYTAISKISKSKIIVDSSKFPAYGAILNLIPNFEVYTIHLIRDPRAVAYSWMNPKKDIDPNSSGFIPTINILNSSLKWVYWNMSAVLLRNKQAENKYHRILYEEFSLNPFSNVMKTLAWLQGHSIDQPPDINNLLILKKNHTISGNPNRYTIGSINIQPDRRWISGMKSFDRIMVSMITFPLILFFGYKLIIRKNNWK